MRTGSTRPGLHPGRWGLISMCCCVVSVSPEKSEHERGRQAATQVLAQESLQSEKRFLGHLHWKLSSWTVSDSNVAVQIHFSFLDWKSTSKVRAAQELLKSCFFESSRKGSRRTNWLSADIYWKNTNFDWVYGKKTDFNWFSESIKRTRLGVLASVLNKKKEQLFLRCVSFKCQNNFSMIYLGLRPLCKLSPLL